MGFDRAQAAKEAEALAGGTLTDVEPFGEIIQSERIGSDEKQAIDFAHRLREAQILGDTQVQVDHFRFIGGQGFGLFVRGTFRT
jgi:hypothetical protein